MKNRLFTSVLTGALLSVSLLASTAHANLIENGGFEGPDLDGWTTVNSGLSSDNATVWVNTVSGERNYANTGNSTGPSERVMFQDFMLPDMDITFASFSFDFFSANTTPLDSATYTSARGDGDSFRIDIVATNTPVFDAPSLYTLFADPGTAGDFSTISQNGSAFTSFLNDFSGDTLRLRFSHDETSRPWQTGVDNVVLVAESSAQPPTAVSAPSTIAILAMSLIGFVSRRVRNA